MFVCKMPVIPAKAGTFWINGLERPGFRRDDGFGYI
jgi:hypothetical protein